MRMSDLRPRPSENNLTMSERFPFFCIEGEQFELCCRPLFFLARLVMMSRVVRSFVILRDDDAGFWSRLFQNNITKAFLILRTEAAVTGSPCIDKA